MEHRVMDLMWASVYHDLPRATALKAKKAMTNNVMVNFILTILWIRNKNEYFQLTQSMFEYFERFESLLTSNYFFYLLSCFVK